ncbi:MAG TPA: hypothetical protein VMX14_13325 [Anaerolineae bacterium]|nr:hypothetical protein [Anaerolineae bacterium]
MKQTARAIYRETLGITTGDVITTSYKSGPYSVKQITGPYTFHATFSDLTIWPYPVIPLALSYVDPSLTSTAYIHNIHREPDGRYLTDTHDEIFVHKTTQPLAAQLPLLTPATQPEYPYQPGVNYAAGDSHVWHCRDCGKDFNAEKQNRHCGPPCPYCTRRFPTIAIPIIVMGNGQPRSSYVRAINA